MLGAVLLAMSALRDQAGFFYAPGDVARSGLPLDRAVRIGGMVRRARSGAMPDGVTIDFLVGDETPATDPGPLSPASRPTCSARIAASIAEGRFQADGTLRRQRDPRQA